MAKHMPPVPPEQRPPHGDAHVPDQNAAAKDDARSRDLAHQGSQGNIKQNTSHQGNQQDR